MIVGGGLAGLSAAMRLSGSGRSVAVVERLDAERYPRYHAICGEAVSERMLSRVGWRPEAVTARVSSLVMSFGPAARIEIPVDGCIVDRPAVLGEMRSLCDAEFVRGAASSVGRDGEGFTVRLLDGRALRCRELIGADGAHSVVRRDVFGLEATEKFPIVNCLAEGDGGSVLRFEVAEGYNGGYRWTFPSGPGVVSYGYPKGMGEPPKGLICKGARDLPFGVLPRVREGSCLLVGDAACLANPLCYGGIGAALLSGRKAAEALLDGRPGRYETWVSRDRMFDPHFMSAHRTFASWGDAEIADAMAPFAKGYSLWNGLRAILRRPRYANVYMAVYLALRLGW